MKFIVKSFFAGNFYSLPLAWFMARLRCFAWFCWATIIFASSMGVICDAEADGNSIDRQAAFGSPFQRQALYVGYANRNFWNPNPPRPPSPFFWRASTHADQGFMLMYLHRIKHSKRYFGANWGFDLGNWWHGSQHQMSGSAFFDFRVWPINLPYFSPYLEYSVAGITLLSKEYFAGSHLGTNFLFQDFMGVGARFGRGKHLELSLKIVHYSNGDTFTINPGFDVPVVMMLGYAF